MKTLALFALAGLLAVRVTAEVKGFNPMPYEHDDTNRNFSPSEAYPMWTTLFNGTNLDGWAVMNDGKFSVTNGVIHIAGGMGWLRTEKTYTNFVLEAEWRGLETNYNSGFFLRCGVEGERFPTNGWQVNLKQSDLGAWLKNKDIIFSPKPAIVPENEWAKFTMQTVGTNATLWLNGKKLWEHGFDAASGYLGIQAEGRAMEVRNVRVRTLP